MPDTPDASAGRRTVDDIRRAWRYQSNVAARDIGILLDVIDRLIRDQDDTLDMIPPSAGITRDDKLVEQNNLLRAALDDLAAASSWRPAMSETPAQAAAYAKALLAAWTAILDIHDENAVDRNDTLRAALAGLVAASVGRPERPNTPARRAAYAAAMTAAMAALGGGA